MPAPLDEPIFIPAVEDGHFSVAGQPTPVTGEVGLPTIRTVPSAPPMP
jgi:hypothetical protein